ncbi:MAG: hypothetical protein WA139_02300 [Candidatus Aenigmatarchaeota archaeon]
MSREIEKITGSEFIEGFGCIFTTGDFEQALGNLFTWPVDGFILQNIGGERTNVYIHRSCYNPKKDESVKEILHYDFKEEFKGYMTDYVRKLHSEYMRGKIKQPRGKIKYPEEGILLHEIEPKKIRAYNFNPKKV